MSCKFCEHWRRPSDFKWESDEDQSGKCTLNPIWIDTDHRHFCSHAFYGSGCRIIGSSSLVHENNLTMHNTADELSAARNELARLKKVAKELRAKLRGKGRAEPKSESEDLT